MIITKDILKAEIDKIQDGYLEILYRIIQAFIKPLDIVPMSTSKTTEWQNFINQTYGCLADDPIERPDQGEYEVRERIGVQIFRFDCQI